MDQLTAFLTRRNIIALLIIGVLAAGLLVGLRLVQQQTQLKSKAAELMPPAPTEPFPCNRPTQYQIGQPVGRCGSADANGCYLTAYATYTDATLDINGDGVADPNDPQDQPQCDASNCTEPKQCPTVVTSPPPPPPSPPPPSPPPAGNVGVGGIDVGTCSSITIDGLGISDHPGLVKDQQYQVKITMTNTQVQTAQNNWGQGYYLSYVGSSASQLGITPTRINVPNPPVTVGESRPFDLTFRPTAVSSGNGFEFYWQMYNNSNEPFSQGNSGKCTPKLKVSPPAVGAPGAPGTCPVGSPAGFIAGADRKWDCRSSDNIFGCVVSGLPAVGGVPGEQLTCSTAGQACVACTTVTPPATFPFGQCGVCRSNPKTQVEDPNCDDFQATKKDEDDRCRRKVKIDSKEFKDRCQEAQCISASRSRDCLICWGTDCEVGQSFCTDPAKPFCQPTGNQRGFCLAEPQPSPSPPPPPPPPAPPVGTACFFLDDKPITATSCSAPGAQAYISHPMVLPLILTSPGRKTIFARFISTTGAILNRNRVINFTPSPTISDASCTHATSGQGTQITISGASFGPRGKGKVRVGGADTTIINWNEATNTITASLDKRIEGKNDVEVTRDDGKTARAECTVGTTSVSFIAQSQCKPSGNFSADNVSVKIFANAPTTVETEKPDPIIDEKVKLDKDGKPSGFAPKLEKDKKYSLIVKAPGTLAKRVDFETKGGTKNLDPTTLLIGDIAPTANPDGKVNAFDKSELIRQWSLVRDVQRSGDFNQDARVNSIDYACMRQNINQSDETFSPPSGAPSASPIASPFASPTATASASPVATPSATPSGRLPFRVSFDPNFTTTAVQGDMGVATSLTIDLTLTGRPGLKSVYVQYFENGVWGPTPPQTASILLL